MTQRLLTGTLTLAAAFLYGSLAQAQYGQGGMYAPQSVYQTIERVHEDLNRAYRGWTVTPGDRRRLNDAEHELREFAQRWERGQFNKGKLDHAIAAIQHVEDNNHMPPREWEVLNRDLAMLRGMREAYDRHEIGRW